MKIKLKIGPRQTKTKRKLIILPMRIDSEVRFLCIAAVEYQTRRVVSFLGRSKFIWVASSFPRKGTKDAGRSDTIGGDNGRRTAASRRSVTPSAEDPAPLGEVAKPRAEFKQPKFVNGKWV